MHIQNISIHKGILCEGQGEGNEIGSQPEIKNNHVYTRWVMTYSRAQRHCVTYRIMQIQG